MLCCGVTYGWMFLAIAIVLGALAFAGYAGAYAFTAKLAAVAFMLGSLFAFVVAKREPTPQ